MHVGMIVITAFGNQSVYLLVVDGQSTCVGIGDFQILHECNAFAATFVVLQNCHSGINAEKAI